MRILLCGLLLAVIYETSAVPTVHAPWGQIQGVQSVTDDWTAYHAYHAIPYALPPTGLRRFAKPVSHPGIHDHTFNASTPGPSCMQSFTILPGGAESEDCLTLDVYTPVSVSHFSDLPVIVYIHGGGFIGGQASAFSGGVYAAKGIIMVVLQYRLGAFGFLSTGDAASQGNYGLWDQHLALQWVKTNIHAFGGDISKITIMGESAGSASVAFQTLYEGSKGLFQRAILQSGAATSLWAINKTPVKTTYELAKKVGCGTANLDHPVVVNCLRSAPASSIAKASWPLGQDPVSTLFEFYFVPTVDGEFIKNDPHVLMNSHQFLRKAGLQDLDVMVAVNSNEGGLLLGQADGADKILKTSMSKSLVNRTFYRDHLIPEMLDLYFGSHSTNMVEVVDFELTFPDTDTPTVDLQKVLDTSSDPSIVVPTIAFADAHASLNTSKQTYMYLFDHTPTFIPHVVDGLLHGQDQFYVFGLGKAMEMYLNITSVSQAEKRISDIIISFLAEFARTGNPSAAVRGYTGSDWPEFTTANQEYFVLNSNPSLRSHPYRRRFALWTQLLPQMLKDWQIAKNTTTNHGNGNGNGNQPLLPHLIG